MSQVFFPWKYLFLGSSRETIRMPFGRGLPFIIFGNWQAGIVHFALGRHIRPEKGPAAAKISPGTSLLKAGVGN